MNVERGSRDHSVHVREKILHKVIIWKIHHRSLAPPTIMIIDFLSETLVRPIPRYVHIEDLVKTRKSLPWGVEKSPKYCKKMIFVKKIDFFIMRKVMLILRFPHSFGVWGFWGRSNSIHFAIFRVSGTPKSMISTKSCPGSSGGLVNPCGMESSVPSCAPVYGSVIAGIDLKPSQDFQAINLCCRYIFGFSIFSPRKNIFVIFFTCRLADESIL